MNAQTTADMPSADFIQITSIFSNTERRVITKDFKGGHIQQVFGNIEIDLSNADLSGVCELYISQAFGSVKLVVPNNWHVELHLKNLLAVVEDHRPYYQKYSPDKKLVISGFSAFSYIEYESIGETGF